ncbi:4-alpha-glucanotransferase [Sunxiuqinia sp. A32]|uniref:4-alpha-glucanotransferase n=1 Tax=Sunxiuqinia sp. A32 TaxID=3461496 RepID=UPI004045CBE9
MIKRSSGILLHISSLPSRYGIGTMGEEAFRFVDFLYESGQKIWQILPIGPTGYGNSPYQSFSAFAGSALLISLDKLVEEDLLQATDLEGMKSFSVKKVEYDLVAKAKDNLLRKAFKIFQERFEDFKEDYYTFLGENSWWLDDYALFSALKGRDHEKCWNQWEEELRFRLPKQLEAVHHEYADDIYFHRFVQFIFFKQWFALKAYANAMNVSFIGDLPLYVSLDSADVWSNQDLFHLDKTGQPTFVGGVPPDYFSETGQLWGCPVFNWAHIKKRKFDWWVARVHFNLNMFDEIRIDHFRGLESYWSVPASEKTAINGKWEPAKGYELLNLLKSQLGELRIIAEDLGVITPEVERLRDEFNLPGMKVLQFAYASDETNEHLPHNYTSNFVVYTGTHDNDTTLGWAKSMTKRERKNVKRYLGVNSKRVAAKLIELAWASVANKAVIPLQDLLGLDSKARMNVPGVAANNWEWRFKWTDIKEKHKSYLKELTEIYNR